MSPADRSWRVVIVLFFCEPQIEILQCLLQLQLLSSEASPANFFERVDEIRLLVRGELHGLPAEYDLLLHTPFVGNHSQSSRVP